MESRPNILNRVQLTLVMCTITVSLHGARPVDNHPSGARSASLSHASVALSDAWSVFHNQAGMANLDAYSASVFYESKYGLKELSLAAAAFIWPVNRGAFGFSMLQFGTGPFKEQKTGLAFARSFSPEWKAGIQLNYLAQTLPENKRPFGVATFEGGVIWNAGEDLALGIHLANPLQKSLNTWDGLKSPATVIRTGGCYQFGNRVLVMFEGEKKDRNPVQFKTGLEFQPASKMCFRLGVSGAPFRYSAGLGFQILPVQLDIGFNYHEYLGVTPSFSLQFQW